MRRVTVLIAAYALALAVTMGSALAPAAAQQSDINAIDKRFEELWKAGNYGAALVEAQKYEATVKARFGSDHTNYAGALNNPAEMAAGAFFLFSSGSTATDPKKESRVSSEGFSGDPRS